MFYNKTFKASCDPWYFPPKGSSSCTPIAVEKNDDPTPEDILAFIISANLPWSIIENPFFRRLIEGPRMNRNLPFESRQSAQVYTLSLLDSYTKDLKASLSSTCRTIAISLDCWTSPNGLTFLGVIGHWLTDNFEYKQHTIEFTELRGHHTGELLATTVYSLLEDFGLTNKLISVTNNNAINNESMVACLTEKLKGANNPFWQPSDGIEKSAFDGDHSMIRCFTHIINLILKELLGVLKIGTIAEAKDLLDGPSLRIPRSMNPLQKIRVIAIWVSRSPLQRCSWKEICFIKEQTEKLIPTDVETRWNSTYYMLETALEKKEVVNIFVRLQDELKIELGEE
ncbi:hypothetical protein N7495_003414 [Penicillium taxi]|uniref:uncharacterized protein n=1 Tax=Penicillium taxi TaxID=168475 RepID=UPI0025450604|nr:uncharacterized protein N7495_003414 [Penicillium taxi]KAJ5902886.1 hypothetical protein N7495_003414 [Penicillium taxi]